MKVIALLVILLMAGCNPRDNSANPPKAIGGMTVYTDSLTQCQYLFLGQALTPRMDYNGKQICGERK